MADAYGTLVFSYSKDACFKDKEIVEELNKFTWDNWGGQWITNGIGIAYAGNTVQYPTTFPSQTKSITLIINGIQKVIDPSELTEEHEEFFYTEEKENISLEYFRDELVQFIDNGWIEIACIANEKLRYVYMEELRIYADGRAFRKKSFIGAGNLYPNTREEEYLTSNSTRK